MFSKKLEKMCIYCAHGKPMNHSDHIICRKKGLVMCDYHCRHYKYDALKRIPPGHPVLDTDFTQDDFKL